MWRLSTKLDQKGERRGTCFRLVPTYKIMFSLFFGDWGISAVHLRYWVCWGPAFDSHVIVFFYVKKKGSVKEFPPQGFMFLMF